MNPQIDHVAKTKQVPAWLLIVAAIAIVAGAAFTSIMLTFSFRDSSVSTNSIFSANILNLCLIVAWIILAIALSGRRAVWVATTSAVIHLWIMSKTSSYYTHHAQSPDVIYWLIIGLVASIPVLSLALYELRHRKTKRVMYTSFWIYGAAFILLTVATISFRVSNEEAYKKEYYKEYESILNYDEQDMLRRQSSLARVISVYIRNNAGAPPKQADIYIEDMASYQPSIVEYTNPADRPNEINICVQIDGKKEYDTYAPQATAEIFPYYYFSFIARFSENGVTEYSKGNLTGSQKQDPVCDYPSQEFKEFSL